MDQKLLTDFRSELLDSRFGAKAISTIAESKRFPLHEMRDDVAFQIINDELYLDGNARQNLATFCQTWDDDNVHKLMDLSINKNWIDKEEYPQSRPALRKSDLWHAPAPKMVRPLAPTPMVLRGLYARRDGDEMALAQAYGSCRQITDKPNWCAVRYKSAGINSPATGMWVREIPMRPGQLFMDPKRMIEACDETPIGVVPTFGVTYTGNYEFPQPLHDALDKFEADTGIDIDMHIDAASGGGFQHHSSPRISSGTSACRV